MAHKLVADMTVERFRAWQDLLRDDRALSHKVGILAVRGEGTTFKPGVLHNDLSASRDSDYQAMQAYSDGIAFEYSYEKSVQAVTEREAEIAPGRYACLLVFDDDVSLSRLRPRVDVLIAARAQVAAAAVEASAVIEMPPPQSQVGAA